MITRYFLFIFVVLGLSLSLSCSNIKFASVDLNEVATAIPTFSVGEKDEYIEEKFRIKKSTRESILDILIVVDSSGSMERHLENLGESLSGLLSVIQDYNWQIAFTTADHGDQHNRNNLSTTDQDEWKDHLGTLFSHGTLINLDNGKNTINQKILNKKTKNYEDIFYHTLTHEDKQDCKRPPYCTGVVEQPLRSLKAAIERSGVENHGFFRKAANLVSIVITNEDERSNDQKRATKAQDVINSFDKRFKNLDKKFVHFNIMVKDAACKSQEKNSHWEASKATIGHIVGELADKTGGKNISICSQDYGSQLSAISKHIKSSLENSIVLLKQPIKNSIKVTFRRKGQNKLSWSVYGRTIVFKGELHKDQDIIVRYKAK